MKLNNVLGSEWLSGIPGVLDRSDEETKLRGSGARSLRLTLSSSPEEAIREMR